jgi:transcriptional regulator with XRE-family HTH domain
MDKQPTFGERIRAARKAKGLTLERVALAVGVTVAYICSIELGSDKPPMPAKVKRLCGLLGLDYQEMQALAYLEKKPGGLKVSALRKQIGG